MRAELRAGLGPGLKWGAIVGAAVYLAGIALGFFNQVLLAGGTTDATQRPILLVPICLGFFVLLFACSAAGFYTGRETGLAGMGAVAGMVVYIVSNLLTIVYLPGRGFGAASLAGASDATNFIYGIIGLLLDLGIAGCMGWLGGRPGARRSPLAAKPQSTPETSSTPGDPYATRLPPSDSPASSR